jgi:hypothetical protein
MPKAAMVRAVEYGDLGLGWRGTSATEQRLARRHRDRHYAHPHHCVQNSLDVDVEDVAALGIEQNDGAVTNTAK